MSGPHWLNRHLSPEQLSEWVLGDRDAKMIQHVSSCANCRAQVEDFEAVLGGFRRTVRTWSEEQLPYHPRALRPRQPHVWAVTAVCALASFVLVVLLRHEGRVSAKEEAAVFIQIDQETSRTVPAAMDPLSELVAGDGARAAANKTQ
jgi:hypothetical protein